MNIPVLRKDFIIDKIQVFESRAAGADAILLIARILDNNRLRQLYALAKELGMDVIVEVHSEKELRRIMPFSFDIIGINNRNLDTLKVDLNTTAKLAPFVSKEAVIISESGIFDLKDILLLKGLGVDAVLVGTVLMRSASVLEKIKELNIDG
ncbi:MAG: indole-3-glycerol phosphate synthase TrpC [Candidatus Omnitrophota bacterium]